MEQLTALVLNCTLKPSPSESSTDLLSTELIAALREHDVQSDLVRELGALTWVLERYLAVTQRTALP